MGKASASITSLILVSAGPRFGLQPRLKTLVIVVLYSLFKFVILIDKQHLNLVIIHLQDSSLAPCPHSCGLLKWIYLF
jgi:hypothetical protein